MRRQLAAGMAALVLIGIAIGAEPQPTAPLEELDTVLVTGEQPGPGLWKVSRDDHVMWVLPVYAPLPKGMTWRSKQIEARIAESQEVLLGGKVAIRPNIGILRGITLVPAALKAGKNPGGQTLQQVLPPDIYARWLVLRQKYIGKDDDIEKWRPVFALSQLQSKAMEKNGLEGNFGVYVVVHLAAKKHKVRIHQLPDVERVIKLEDPRGMLKAADKVENLECFILGLDAMEPGIERARTRANAWARGDIAKLRELERGDIAKLRELEASGRKIQDECGNAQLATMVAGESADAARVRKLMADFTWHAQWAGVQAQNEWVAAAQAALQKNKSTFTILGLNDVLNPEGTLEKLRKLGYTVEEPL
jgi:uncharacterized protein YbaP (TraB family)